MARVEEEASRGEAAAAEEEAAAVADEATDTTGQHQPLYIVVYTIIAFEMMVYVTLNL